MNMSMWCATNKSSISNCSTSPNSAPAVTSVVSQYPAISHTFILGEFNGLKENGLNVQVASINQPDRLFEKLTDVEKKAYKDTTFVKLELKKTLPIIIFKFFFNFPIDFFKSLGASLRSGFKYPNTLGHKIAYWLEAMVVADMARGNGGQQLHAHFSTQACTVAMLGAVTFSSIVQLVN